MSQYKLTYFNGRGRAELIRLVLAQAGVQYEDHRIVGEDWKDLKPKTPFGTVPILEVDGKTLGGSIPIAVFLAQRHGLAGANDFENAEIAGIMDCLGDLMLGLMAMLFEKDEAHKAELKKKLHVRRLGLLQLCRAVPERGSGQVPWAEGTRGEGGSTA